MVLMCHRLVRRRQNQQEDDVIECNTMHAKEKHALHGVR